MLGMVMMKQRSSPCAFDCIPDRDDGGLPAAVRCKFGRVVIIGERLPLDVEMRFLHCLQRACQVEYAGPRSARQRIMFSVDRRTRVGGHDRHAAMRSHFVLHSQFVGQLCEESLPGRVNLRDTSGAF